MKITLRAFGTEFTGETDLKLVSDLPQTRRGFVPLRDPQGKSIADAIHWSGPHGDTVIIANGSLGRPSQMVAGEAFIDDQEPTFVSIMPGCYAVLMGATYDVTQPLYKPEFCHWYIRDLQVTWPKEFWAYLYSVKVKDDSKNKNTGDTGSARMTPGDLPALVGLVASKLANNTDAAIQGYQARLLYELQDWVHVQGQRGHHWYHADGTLWRASYGGEIHWEGGWRKDPPGYDFPQGWKYEYKSHDPQHFTITEALALYAVTGDPLALWEVESLMEAQISENQFKKVEHPVETSTSNQRNFGWFFQASGLAQRVLERPDWVKATEIMLERLNLCKGEENGILYPSLAPKKADHANLRVCVWQTFIMLEGLEMLLEVMNGHPFLKDLYLHVGKCATQEGQREFINVDTLLETKPETLWNDYDPNGQGHSPSSSYNGTIEWNVGPMLGFAERHNEFAKSIKPICKKIYAGNAYSKITHKDTHAVTAFGLRVLKYLGVKT